MTEISLITSHMDLHGTGIKTYFIPGKKVIMDGNKGNKKRLQPTRAFKAAFLIRPDKKNTRKNLLSRCFHFIKRSESVKLEFIS